MFLTAKDISKIMNVSERTARRYIAKDDKKIKSVLPNGHFEYRIPLESLSPEFQLKYWEYKKACEGSASISIKTPTEQLQITDTLPISTPSTREQGGSFNAPAVFNPSPLPSPTRGEGVLGVPSSTNGEGALGVPSSTKGEGVLAQEGDLIDNSQGLNAIKTSSKSNGGDYIPAVISSVNEAKDWQREVADARLAIIKRFAGQRKVKQQIIEFLENIPDNYAEIIKTANLRDKGLETLSYPTVLRWIERYERLGYQGLLPKTRQSMVIPEWGAEIIQLMRRPSRPSLHWVLETMTALNKSMGLNKYIPTYSSAYRFLQKFSRLDIQKGRMSSREIKACKGYIRRSTDYLYPMDILVVDGHSYKAKVKHPIHGQPFFPEICCAIDAATRIWVGWSIGVAESSSVVSSCIRHAMTITKDKIWGGVPNIVYTDRGAGNMAKFMTEEVSGFFDRVGILHKTGIPGNPQGRGLIERFNAHLINIAREMPSFRHESGSQDAYRKIYLMIEKDIREKGDTDKAMGWNQFVYYLNVCQYRYNMYHEHTSLPKTTDQETGRIRHMTPNEMYQSFVASGWQPETLDDDELESLKRPRIKAVVRRAQVSCLGNKYYNKELAHYDKMEMQVEYDEHDPMFVWVRDMEGRLVCVAEWNANVKDYMPVSAHEQANEKRAKARLKRIDNRVQAINAELRPAIEYAPQQTLPDQVIKEAEEIVTKLEKADELARIEAMRQPEIPVDMFDKYLFWKEVNRGINAGDVFDEKIMAFWRDWQYSADFRACQRMDDDLDKDFNKGYAVNG